MLKRYTRYIIDFDSKYTAACGGLFGAAFFLKIVYYFALVSFRDVGIVQILCSAFLGISLCAGMVVLLNCVRYNAPGIYGIAGMTFCLILMLLNLMSGSLVRSVLSIVWYIPTAVVFLMTVGGHLPGRKLAVWMFLLASVVRFLFFDLGRLGLIGWVNELAVLLMLISFACMAMGLRSIRQSK
ncbi:MAG: hypothetical protein E7462_04625 [Ruminococcaceae bacterium]|nr:hypothetical protein [Oscillospiraceae bacterium]